MQVKVVSICDIISKEQFIEWLRTLPLNYTPKRQEAVAERAQAYSKCIWSKYHTNELDPGLNFFKLV